MKKLVFLFISALIIGSLLILWNDSREPAIQITPSVVDLGPVAPGHVIKKVVTIGNLGSRPLIISRVRSTCACDIIENHKKSLAPRETMEIPVSFLIEDQEGLSTSKIYIHSNDPRNTIATIDVTMLVRRPLDYSPKSLLLTLTDATTISESIVISNFSDVPLELQTITYNDQWFSIRAQETGLSRNGQQQFYIEVFLNPDAPGGILEDTLFIHSDSPDIPIIEIPISCTKSVKNIEIIPEKLFFNFKGEIMEIAVLMKNKEIPFQITGIDQGSLELEAIWQNEYSLAQKILVRVTSVAKGIQKGSLIISTDRAGDFVIPVVILNAGQ